MPEERKVYRRPARTAAPAPQAGQTAPRPDAPPPPKKKKRPGAKRRRSRLVLGLCLLCLLVVVIVSVVLVRCSAEEAGPAEADFGTPAAAWQKNDLGYYFNTSGRAMPAAVLKGMDVSKFQGEIDWEKAKAAGIDFAIIRCGFGGEWDGQEENWAQDDPQWRRNADECTRLGIPFGAYLYSYATTVEEARSEADHVARLLGLTAPPQEGLDDYTAAPYRLSYPVYYDLEDKYISGVFPSEMAEITQAFFDRLTEYGYTGAQGLYASRNWVRARMTDPAFDKWRDNLWIARFSDDLDYAGTYDMWQCTFSAPGADYGVQSETVDLDFVMKPFKFTGVSACNGKTAAPVLLNDTYTDELHMDGKDAYATLATNEPGEKDGGRRVYWTTSDKTVATVDKNGTVRARTDSGECTITATLADGTESLTCRVRAARRPNDAGGRRRAQGRDPGFHPAGRGRQPARHRERQPDRRYGYVVGVLGGGVRPARHGADRLCLRHDPPGQRCQHGQRPVAGVQPAEQRGHRCVLPLHKLEPQPRDQWPLHRRGARGV